MFNIHFSIERWKYNSTFELYVSNKGRIRNRSKADIAPKIMNSGYCVVFVHGSINRYMLLHRIVMLTWKPTPEAEHLTVDHLDHNKRNNALSNLEWVTKAENLRRAERDYVGDVETHCGVPGVSIPVTKKVTSEKGKANKYRAYMKTVTHFMIEPDTRHPGNVNRPTFQFPLTEDGYKMVKSSLDGVVTNFDLKSFKNRVAAMLDGANQTGRFYYCGMYVHPVYPDNK